MLQFPYHRFTVFYRDTQDLAIIHEVLIDACYDFCAAEIQKARTIIDLGAHIGTFAFYCAYLNKKVQIYAYEAFEESVQLLKYNMDSNKIQCIPVQALIGNTRGIESLQLSKKNQNHSSIQAFFPLDQIIQVSAITLEDTFIQHHIEYCDILKMDIEGAEFKVLASTPSELFAKIGAIVLEYHEHDQYSKQWLIDFLESQAFFLEYEEESKYKKGIGMMFFKKL